MLPIVAPERSARMMVLIGEENEQQAEVGTGRLFLPLAHRMGHEELVDAVASVVATIPEHQRSRTAILAESYGPAAAIERMGAGLPPVYSGHNNYYLWGPPVLEPEVVIAVGFEPEQLLRHFVEVEVSQRTR
jgi:hypothetical protein